MFYCFSADQLIMLTLDATSAFNISSSSTGPSSDDVPPPYGSITMALIYMMLDMCAMIVATLLCWNLPASLLTKICIRLMGFDAVIHSVHLGPEEQATDMQPLIQQKAGQSTGTLNSAHSDSTEHHSNDMLAPLRTAEKAYSSSETLPSPAAVAHPIRQRMRTIPGRMFVMGLEIDVNGVDSADPAESTQRRARAKRITCGKARLWFSSIFSRFVPSVLAPRPLGVRVARSLRMLLWLAIWSSLVYLVEVLILHVQQMTLSNSNEPQQCPDSLRGLWCFDNDSPLTEDKYVDCYRGSDATIPPHTKRLLCYGLQHPTGSTVIAGISSVTALFSLFFGGCCMVLSWALQFVHSRRALWWIRFCATVGFITLYTLMLLRFETTVLFVIIPNMVIGAVWFISDIRGMIAQQQQLGALNDNPNSCCASTLKVLCCPCRLDASEEENEDIQDSDLTNEFI